MMVAEDSAPLLNERLSLDSKIFRAAGGILVAISMLALSLVASQRGMTFDTQNYRAYFYDCHYTRAQFEFFDEQHFEIGFQLFTRGIATITDSSEIYFFLVTLVSISLFVKGASNIGASRGLALAYFSCSLFPLLFLVQMRQGLADCMAFCGMTYFSNRKHGPALLLLVAAVTIHVSSAVVLLLVVAHGVMGNLRIPWWLSIAFIAIALCAGKILLYGTNWSRVTFYLLNPEYSGPADVFRLSSLKFVLVVGLAIVVFGFRNKAYALLILACATGVLIRFVFYDNYAFSGRLGAHLTFAEVYLIPSMFSRWGYAATAIVFPAFCLLSLYYLLFIEHHHLVELY